jgi:pyruvate dehydrogenase E2 component (dihydrolipoamide acetyltransferase)
MDVLMPQLGETVAEGTLTIWHKSAGDKVTSGELLFEIGTDKVEMEVPAPATGVLQVINVDAGETVPVGTVLAVIDDGKAASPAKETPKAEPAKAAESASAPAPAAAPAVSKPAARGDQHKLSPVVRKLVAENNLDPAQITGTGRDGRIKKADVLAYLKGASAAAPAARPSAPAPAPAPRSGDGRTVIPFNRIRQMTAEHMVRSKTVSPHVHQGMEVDFSGVDRARKAKGAAWKAREGFSLNYLPFIARAVCDAIAEFPNINAHVEGDNLVVHDSVNLSIAVDLNFEGLVAPVIQNASAMTAVEIARAVADLANRARSNQLTSDDYAGATYTISNNGSFGTYFTTPIINQPQVAILSTDAITQRPWVVNVDGEDMMAIRPIGVLTQAFDHRAIDGAYSAAFLRRLKEIIETKDWSAALP